MAASGRGTDFHPLPESIQARRVEPFGFFRFQPSEPFDVSLVDRLLASATAHADRVDCVVLPESSVPHTDLGALEAVLSRHGVTLLIAGLRDEPGPGNRFGSNWVHFGAALDGQWSHYRQDKHHRWSLDRSQIEQYHLAEVLDPRVRWWEALELNRRSLQVLERDDGHVIASLVCEDLAHIDDVVDLMRAVGPTLVVALLLDGPQLASRWTARYASVLSDDPGSAVLTLTSYGMVANAWRDRRAPVLRRRAMEGQRPGHARDKARPRRPRHPPGARTPTGHPPRGRRPPSQARRRRPTTLRRHPTPGRDPIGATVRHGTANALGADHRERSNRSSYSARTGASWRIPTFVHSQQEHALNALAPTCHRRPVGRLTPAHAISRCAERRSPSSARTQGRPHDISKFAGLLAHVEQDAALRARIAWTAGLFRPARFR